MKRFLTIAFVFIVSVLNAQKLHFGPTLSLNLSQVKGKGLDSKMQTGLQGGGFLQWEISKKWSIQPELLYTIVNVERNDKFLVYYNITGRQNSIARMQLNYLTIPLLARYEWKRFSLLAGPQYSYLFHADENLLKTNDAAFSRSNLSATLGAQFNLDNVGFYIRYNKGLSDINDIDSRYKWANNNMQIGVSLRLR